MTTKLKTLLEDNNLDTTPKIITPSSATTEFLEHPTQLADWPPEPEIIPLETLNSSLRHAFPSPKKTAFFSHGSPRS